MCFGICGVSEWFPSHIKIKLILLWAGCNFTACCLATSRIVYLEVIVPMTLYWNMKRSTKKWYWSTIFFAELVDLETFDHHPQPNILCGWSGHLEQSPTAHSFHTYIINVQKHAKDTSVLSFLLHWLFCFQRRAANFVQRPCSDSSHVTARYKLSFHYYYLLLLFLLLT